MIEIDWRFWRTLPNRSESVLAVSPTTCPEKIEGTVQVEGRLEGEVSLKGAITIATSGVIQGPVTADIVRVAGNVQGSIIAREHLFLERTGEIHGDVSTASLVIENGRLDGRSTMLSEHDLPLKEPKRYEPRITEEDPVL